MVGSDADRFALLVLKPDAVHQGLEPAICAFLGTKGFLVERAVLLQVSAETRYRLYRPDLTPWNTNWRLGNGLFALGPALVLLLSNDRVPSGHDSASQLLSCGLKGHHDPLRASPGTIRGEFNSVNRALNLVHAADDSRSLLRELPILLDSPDGVERPVPDAGRAAPPRHLDFGAAILRVHEWLLAERGDEAGPRTAAADVIRAARTSLESTSLEAAPARHARRAVVVAALAAIERLARGRRDEAGRLALALADRARFAEVDYESVFDRLRAAGLGLDAWTRYLLHTSLYYLDPVTESSRSPER